MNEHLTEGTIERYRRREIDPAVRQETDFHLATCEVCLKRVLNSEHSVIAFDNLTEAFLPSVDEQPFHLSHAELKQFSAGAPAEADRIICESHLDICEQCRENLRLLSAAPTRAAVGMKSSRERFVGLWARIKERSMQVSDNFQPDGIPRRRARAPAVPVKRLNGWPAGGSFTPARLAAVLALVVLAALVALAMVFWRRQSSRNEFARSGPTETPTTSPSPAPSNEATPKVTNEPDTAVVVLLKDNGKEIRLDQQGKLTGLEDFDESSQKIVKSALAGEALRKPKVLDELALPAIKLLGESPSENTFQLTSPLSKVVVEERPTLRWRPLSGATSYVVSVFDAQFNRVGQSPPLSEPVWTLRAPLQRGRTYAWEVTAVKEGKEITAPAAPAPRAQFRVLEAEQRSALTKLKEQQPVSHLTLGLMYARFGLVSEAEREFRLLAKENPDSALARKLLRTVQAWRK